MTVTGGRVVVTPGEAQPYKVVLEHEQTNDTEHPVATVSEGEVYIRSKRLLPAGAAFDFGGPRESPAGDGGWSRRD
ncbi:MAG: hypothetical protein QOH04_3252 [Sphingomonadales bacterium]|jgi:hypothetical protein|nr:hypothetical protein [Sphingomonadales bacterium]MEA3037450.1 hypothetical protein [Sphingomonadales bacterium]